MGTRLSLFRKLRKALCKKFPLPLWDKGTLEAQQRAEGEGLDGNCRHEKHQH